MIANQFRLSANAPCEVIAISFPRTGMRECDDTCLQIIAGMLMENTGSEHIRLTGYRVHLFGLNIAGRFVIHRAVGEHILSGNVEILPLVGIKTAGIESDVYL